MTSNDVLASTILVFQVMLISDLLRLPLKRIFYRYVYMNSPHWKNFSRKAKDRAGWTCQVRDCSQKTRLQTHHKTYKNLWREKPEDVVVLCYGHHLSVEQGRSLRLKDGSVLPGFRKR